MIRRASPSDWHAIEHLLASSGLPLDGARDHLKGFLVVEEDGAITACAAVERYGHVGLLRSVAVATTRRGTGLGERLVNRAIEDARAQGLRSLLLLTTTATEWFPRFGFQVIVREKVPVELNQSAELRGACPSTAVVMSLELGE